MYPFKICFAFILIISFFYSCNVATEYGNPPAEGFNLDGSDPKAIEIADMVMEASGGRKNWDNTEILKWNFFGNREHEWNKQTGDISIRSERDSLEIKMNLNTMEGEVEIAGIKLTKADSLDKYLERGKAMWINDSYWLFMPYKLKDTGVTLKYLGEKMTQDKTSAEVLELSFVGVGNTPDNKYHVYVDKETNLVCQWEYFRNYQDTIPRITNPWTDYADYNGLILSSGRGRETGMENIGVEMKK